MSQSFHILNAIVSTNVRGFVRGMNSAAGSVNTLRGAWMRAASDIVRAGQRIAGAIAAIGLISSKQFADFERTMVRVKNVIGATSSQFDALTAAARKMGRDTEFTAREAAQAMEFLGLAGLKTSEVIESLPKVLQLATAANIELAQAADIAAVTMKAFGLQSSDLERINDTLVAGFTNSNTNLAQLAEALKLAAPVARTAGVSLETTVAILAKMADAGFRGSLAGTALRNSFNRLSKPSRESEKLLKSLGVTMHMTFVEKLRLVQEGLQRATSESEKLRIAFTIFGVRGGPQMIEILDKGIEGVEEFADMLEHSGGVAKQFQKDLENTLSGQFNILKAAVESLALDIGKELLPVVKEMIQDFKAFLDTHSDQIVTNVATAFRGLVTFAREAAVAFADMWPTIQQATRMAWQFLKPILDFLREHPKLMAALIALKIGGFFGITQALTSVLRLFPATIAGFGKLGRAIGGIKPVASGGSAAMRSWLIRAELLSASGIVITAAVAGLLLLADHFELLGKKASQSAEEQKQAINKMIDARARLERKKTQKERESAKKKAQASAPAGQRAAAGVRGEIQALQKRNEELSRQSVERKKSQSAAERRIVQLKRDETTLGIPNPGLHRDKIKFEKQQVEHFKRDRENIEQQIAENDEEIAKLKEEEVQIAKDSVAARRKKLVDLGKEIRRRPGGVQKIGRFDVFGDKKHDEAEIKLREQILADMKKQEQAQRDAAAAAQEAAAHQKKINDQIRQAEISRQETKSPGFGTGVSLLKKGASDAQMARFLNTRRDDAAENARRAARINKQGSPELREMQLARELAAIKALNEADAERTRLAEKQKQTLANNNAKLDEFEQKMLDAHRAHEIGGDAALKLDKKIQSLRQQLNSGAINSDQFKKALAGLNEEQKIAAQQAEQEAAKKRRERIMRLLQGKGTKDDVQFLREQIQQRRFQMLDSQFSQFIDMLAGANNGMQRMNTSIRNTTNNLNVFGRGGLRGLQRAGRESAQQIAQLSQQLNQAFNTRTGRIGLLRNQIALTQQKLQLFSHRRPDMTAGNPFGAIGYRQKREVENELKSLFTDLNRLLFTPPPIFTEMIRGDQGSFFRDPGLQTSGPGITVNVFGQPSGQKLLDTVNQRLSENGFGQFV